MVDSQINRHNQATKSSVVWLTVYEAAKRQGNIDLSNRARRELEKAGVIVKSQRKSVR